jgi:hypothetical protein
MPSGNKLGVPHKYKNITIDTELADRIGLLCTALSSEFGFRPTISQSLRYVIRCYERGEK